MNNIYRLYNMTVQDNGNTRLIFECKTLEEAKLVLTKYPRKGYYVRDDLNKKSLFNYFITVNYGKMGSHISISYLHNDIICDIRFPTEELIDILNVKRVGLQDFEITLAIDLEFPTKLVYDFKAKQKSYHSYNILLDYNEIQKIIKRIEDTDYTIVPNYEDWFKPTDIKIKMSISKVIEVNVKAHDKVDAINIIKSQKLENMPFKEQIQFEEVDKYDRVFGKGDYEYKPYK